MNITNVILAIGVGFVAALMVLALYVRLAPVNAAQWHNPKLPVMGPGIYPGVAGHVEQHPLSGDGSDVLVRLDAIVRASPRTVQIAGDVASGKVTYMTRSRVFGFPDFTTVTLTQIPETGMSTLQVYGRLRFGKADLGVNRARIEGWMVQLDGDTPAQ